MHAYALSLLLALVRPAAGDPGVPGPAIWEEGTVELLVSDDFDAGQSRAEWRLDTGTEILRLEFEDGAPSSLRPGGRVRVLGRPSAGALHVIESEGLFDARTEALASAWTTGPKKVLVILVNFLDDTSQPYTAAAAQNTVFGATGSVAAYYGEVSNGATTLSGDVTPWLTLPINKPTTCDYSTIASRAQTAATGAGYVLSNYQFPMYVFPRVGSCGWAGLGYVGAGGSWINQALSTYVAGHELGHNYGLLHAHSYDCGASAYAGTCSRSEYGDPFDIMGGASRQFNAYSKQYLAWWAGGSVVTTASGTTTVDLSPLESASGVRGVQVNTTKGRTYWVESRQATGFDSGLPASVTNGVLVHVAPSPAGGTDLLDNTPDGSTGSATFGDAALGVGQSFIDPAAGVTIAAVAKNGSLFTVRVDYGTFPAPSASSIAPASGTAAGGASVTIGGSGFLPAAAVTLGGVAATPTAISPTGVTAKAGAHAVGDVDVVVTNADGQSTTLPKAFFYDFTDVPAGSPQRTFVVKLFRDAVTAGCGGNAYCPSSSVTRDQMAVFVLKSEHGSAYAPPAATGAVFADVSTSTFAAAWIERLYAEGTTAGCSTSPLRYCPLYAVSREQMAVFLLRGKHGSAYAPPPATGTVFSDVPLSNMFAPWIEELYAEGITGGCGTSPLRYCPASPVTRGQMAVFLVTTFNLP